MTPDVADARNHFVVPAALAGERVDRAVALHTGWSRSDVQVLVDRELVTVGGRSVAKSRRLEAGEEVAILGAPEAPGELRAEPVELEIVYEDADVVVVAKPAGLVVHPGAGHEHGTLVQGLLARHPEIAGVGAPARPGIVHRLDRDTSGLLVCARVLRSRTTRSWRSFRTARWTGATTRSVGACPNRGPAWSTLRSVVRRPVARAWP